MQLGSVMLYVKDFSRMKAFYTSFFGREPLDSHWPDEYVEFDAGPLRFAVHAIPGEIAKNITVANPPEPRSRGSIKLKFRISDLSAERQKLEILGAQIIVREWQDATREFDVVDPEGNIVQIGI